MNEKGKIYVRGAWGNLMVTGKKQIETAAFSLPERFQNIWLYVQNEKKQIIGMVMFGASKKYASAAEFDQDFKRHLVPDDSPYHFNNRKRCYGWQLVDYGDFEPEKAAPMKSQFRLEFVE